MKSKGTARDLQGYSTDIGWDSLVDSERARTDSAHENLPFCPFSSRLVGVSHDYDCKINTNFASLTEEGIMLVGLWMGIVVTTILAAEKT
eukprot:6174630-Pleurochrysis_carterae.AAC.1